MKKLILIFLILLQLHADESNYKGSSFNLALVYEPSCLRFIGTTKLIDKHFALSTGFSHCDNYTDEDQILLKKSYSGGLGLGLYSTSVYRSGFVVNIFTALEKSWTEKVSTFDEGESLSLISTLSTGYQFHFEKGYMISLQVYINYAIPLTYYTSDPLIKENISKSHTKYHPVLILGWRF